MSEPIEIEFPRFGLYKGGAVSKQPPLTSPSLNNVRSTDKDEERLRGGQRPGLDKWGAGTQVGGSDQPVVAIISVSAVK